MLEERNKHFEKWYNKNYEEVRKGDKWAILKAYEAGYIAAQTTKQDK